MGVAKPYGFIGFGAVGVAKPYEFIGFGALDGPGFGAMDAMVGMQVAWMDLMLVKESLTCASEARHAPSARVRGLVNHYL